MPCSSVVGLQWGDEAKGKIVDILTEEHDFVVRYNGGANAGHTVVRDGKTFKLSLLPTGVISPHITSVIGNGVVVYPPRFTEEVSGLTKAGIAVGDNLLVSNHAHAGIQGGGAALLTPKIVGRSPPSAAATEAGRARWR